MGETLYFGPSPGGAGTAIKATELSAQVIQAPRGPVVMVGPASKGLAGVIRHVDESSARRRRGRPLTDDYIDEAIHGFLDRAKGQGALYTMRVNPSTDLGTPTGQLVLYDRDADAGFASGTRSAKLRSAAGVAEAASAGDWAGPQFIFGGTVADDSAAISGQDFDTGLSGQWAAGELVGAKFVLDNHDRTYTILGNTAGGVLSLDGGFTTYTALTSDVNFLIYRNNVDASGNPMELGLRLGDDPGKPLNFWALTPVIDRAQPIKTYAGLGLTDTAAIELKIEQELAAGGPNEELTLDFSGAETADASLPEARPANWVGVPIPAGIGSGGLNTVAADTLGLAKTSGKRVYLKVFDYVRTAGSNAIAINWTSIGHGELAMPCRITLTGIDSTTMSVAATDLNGASIASGLPTLTKGSSYNPGHPHLPTFTVETTGSTIGASDEYVLEFRPFPTDLRNRDAFVYVSSFAASGSGSLDPTKRYKVIGSGNDYLDLATNDDLSAAFESPRPATHEGSEVMGTLDVSGVGLTFVYTLTVNGVDVASAVTLTAVGGATDSLTTVAGLLAAADLANGNLTFYVTADNKLGVLTKWQFGAQVSLAISGTVLTPAGMTAATYTGVDGALARLEYTEGFRNARPAPSSTITTTDYTTGALAASDDNPLVQFIRAYPGLVHILLPGQTNANLQAAAAEFAALYGAFYLPDAPASDTIADEQQMGAWVRTNDTPNRFHQYFYPTHGYTADSVVTPGKLRKVPLSGAVMGAMVRYANTRDDNGLGWHKAPGGAGRVSLSPYISRLDRGTFGQPQVKTDDAALNNAGILPIVQSGASVYLHGDQGNNSSFVGTFWLHKQKAYLDIITTFRPNFDDLLYAVNNGSALSPLSLLMRMKASAILEQFWRNGSLDILTDGVPYLYENAVKLETESALNPQATRDQGKRIGSAEFRIVGTAKVILWNLLTSGISVPPNLD